MRFVATALVTLLVLTACERRDPQPDTAAAAAPRPAASGDAEQEGFVLLVGNDTLAIERFARHDNELRGSLHDLRNGARLDYVAVVTDDGRVIGMHIDLVEPGAMGPSQRVAVALRGDTVVVEQGGESDPAQNRMLLPPGTTMYLNPSIAMLEAMLQRADRVAEGQGFPVLALDTEGDPSVIEPVVSRDNGTVTITFTPGRDLRLEVEGRSRIVSGENVGQVARFERIR